MEPETKRYRFVGPHADDLASGQQVHPGEFVNFTDNDEVANQRMIEAGALIAAPEAEAEPADKDTEAEPTKPRSNRKATTTKEG